MKEMERYVVASFGWRGYRDIDHVLNVGQYFDTLSKAVAEYERIWENGSPLDKGACVYDTLKKRFIIDDFGE